jgi:hypothetical protein
MQTSFNAKTSHVMNGRFLKIFLNINTFSLNVYMGLRAAGCYEFPNG